MSDKIVIALGGNAILADDPSESAQRLMLRTTSRYLVRLIKAGARIVITHGNSPQVGNLILQQEAAASKATPAMSLDTCVGMTQGSIGYWLQNALVNELQVQNIERAVVSLITQVVVDAHDPGFLKPTKPVGPFLTEAEAIVRTKSDGNVYVQDGGRGFRRVVPSPLPVDILEASSIKTLVDNDVIVIAGGGGGVPVVKTESGEYEGVECVIDKDLASQKLSDIIEADLFVILTGVSHVSINYNQPGQRNLKNINLYELKKLRADGHFAPSSMLMEVDAAIRFVESNPTKKAIITSLDNLSNILGDNPGTLIVG